MATLDQPDVTSATGCDLVTPIADQCMDFCWDQFLHPSLDVFYHWPDYKTAKQQVFRTPELRHMLVNLDNARVCIHVCRALVRPALEILWREPNPTLVNVLVSLNR